jgi:hypothetical protein
MLRLLRMMERLDLEEVRRTGEAARERLAAMAADYKGFVENVRGAGVMLAFDVVRTDWRDVVRDRAFRRGLILLPAGERALRFYPRHDTPVAVLDEAVSVLRAALEDVLAGDVAVTPGPRIRVGECEVPLASVECVDLRSANLAELRPDVMAVEMERYGALADYPPDVLRAGRRPLLQYPVEAIEATLSNTQAIGLALRDSVSHQIVAYAVGSPIENHDEEGVADDPHLGESAVFYLQAMATRPSVRNGVEVQNHLLDAVRERALACGFAYFSTLIEQSVRDNGPQWLRGAEVLRTVENYLRSGQRFLYLQAALAPAESAESVGARSGASSAS